MDDSARAVGSKGRIGLAEEIPGVQITKSPLIRTPAIASNTNKTTDQPSCIGICTTLYLPEQNRTEQLYIAFSATKGTLTTM